MAWLKKSKKFWEGLDKFDIKSDVFDSEYHFSVVRGDGCDASLSLAEEWVRDVSKGNGLFEDCLSFEEALRISRVRVLQKALKDKKISLGEIIRGF